MDTGATNTSGGPTPVRTPGTSITPPNDSAAVAALVEELDRTRRDYSRARLQIAQLTSREAAREAAGSAHNEAMARLENELSKKDKEHFLAVSAVEERAAAREAALTHKVRTLELGLQKATAAAGEASSLEEENRGLRAALIESQEMVERLKAANEDMRRRTLDGAGGQRAGTEGDGLTLPASGTESYEGMAIDLQKRLAATEKKMRAEAYRALSEEARIALRGSDHLQAVLERQNQSIDTVLARCTALERQQGALQEERVQAAAELQQHVAEVRRLSNALNAAKERNQALATAMRQRRVERAALELLFAEYEATRGRLSRAEERARRARREAERWQERAMELAASSNIDQGMQSLSDAPGVHINNGPITARAASGHASNSNSPRASALNARRLKRLAASSEAVETYASRVAARRETRAKALARAAEGALALQSAAGGLNLTDVDSGLVPRNNHIYNNATQQDMLANPMCLIDGNHPVGRLAMRQGTPDPGINPMELLKMWCVSSQANDKNAIFGNNNNNNHPIYVGEDAGDAPSPEHSPSEDRYAETAAAVQAALAGHEKGEVELSDGPGAEAYLSPDSTTGSHPAPKATLASSTSLKPVRPPAGRATRSAAAKVNAMTVAQRANYKDRQLSVLQQSSRLARQGIIGRVPGFGPSSASAASPGGPRAAKAMALGIETEPGGMARSSGNNGTNNNTTNNNAISSLKGRLLSTKIVP